MVGVAVRSLVPGLLQKQVIHKYWWNEQIRTGRPRAPGEPPHRASSGSLEWERPTAKAQGRGAPQLRLGGEKRPAGLLAGVRGARLRSGGRAEAGEAGRGDVTGSWHPAGQARGSTWSLAQWTLPSE